MIAKEGKTERGLRLAELLAAVSLATDLAHDVPAESALRDWLRTLPGRQPQYEPELYVEGDPTG